MHMTSEYSGLADGRLYQLHEFVDASDSIAKIINDIKDKQAVGDYQGAAAYVSTPEIQETIKKSVITAETVNAIEEEIRNIEIKASQKSQQIFYTTSSTDQGIKDVITSGDVWISPVIEID